MKTIYETEQAALAILKSTGVSLIDAALIAKEALQEGRGRIKRARQCITVGAEMIKQQEKTVSFEQAVTAALDARKEGERGQCMISGILRGGL